MKATGDWQRRQDFDKEGKENLYSQDLRILWDGPLRQEAAW